MLVERQLVGPVVELLESRVEPVRKLVVDLLDRLRTFDRGAAGGGAATAGLVRNGLCDAVVERGGQERGLAQARMAGDNDAAPVEVRVRHEIIDRPL